MSPGVLIGLCSAVLTAIVTELYAHRCLAHRAFSVHPTLGRVLDTYFRVIVGTDPESWAAVHRLHHRYADTPLDPHSPLQMRPAMVLLGSPYLFAVARKRLDRNPPGRGRSHLVIRAVAVAFFLLAIGWLQVLVALGVHLACYLGIMGMVNTVGHLYGRKPHPDVPGYDIGWLAIPLLGHGYHNSHHAHPAAARTGPLDPIWPLLRLMATLRLVELDTRHSRRGQASCCRAAAGLAADAG